MNGWPLSEVIRFVLQSFWKNPIIIIFMLITPLLLIFLSSTVLQEEAYELTIGVEEISERMQASLLQQDVNVEQTSTAMALNKLSAGEMDAFFTLENQGGLLILEGSKPHANYSTNLALNKMYANLSADDRAFDTLYLHGTSQNNWYDYIGPGLIAFLAFAFTLICSAMLFSRQVQTYEFHLNGTRFITIYFLLFSILSLIQSLLILSYSIYQLDMYFAGSFWGALLTVWLISLVAVSLGMVVAAFTRTFFQFGFTIFAIHLTQFYFSGILPSENVVWMNRIGLFMPVSYSVEALRDIIIRNEHFMDISTYGLILIIFIAISLRLVGYQLRKQANVAP